jgi:hypothetical protein
MTIPVPDASKRSSSARTTCVVVSFLVAASCFRMRIHLRRVSVLVLICLCTLSAPDDVHSSVVSQSLERCPEKETKIWNNCFGTKFDGQVSYQGDFKNGMLSGLGIYSEKDGRRYVGEFTDGKFNGRGILTYADGRTYDGTFKNNKPHGQGIVQRPDGSRAEVQYVEGQYLGGYEIDTTAGMLISTNIPNGTGSMLLHDGRLYVGNFFNEQFEGAGILLFPDGRIYFGSFDASVINGGGRMAWPDGTVFAGQFQDSRLDGHVSVSYSNGDSFSGAYEGDLRTGEGTYLWKDGSKYSGNWLNGLPTGAGEFSDPGGRLLEGALFKSSGAFTSGGFMTFPDILAYSVEQPGTNPDNLRRVALVIGNSDYQHAPELSNPRNDAEAMAQLMTDLGFEVVKGLDLDKRATEQKISEFVDKAAKADLSLFYYAGHGIQVAGENFIVPVDAKVERASAVDFELVNVDLVTNYMGGEHSVGIAFLDACRDNPFSRSLSRALGNRSTQVGSGLAELRSKGGGLLVAYATAPGEVAADGVGMKNSPFATALLKNLGIRGLEIELVMKRVKADVIAITKNEQRPWTNSDLTAEVYLGGNN